MRATQTALRKFFNGIEPFEGLGLDGAKRDYSWDLPRISFDGTPLHTNKTSFEANVYGGARDTELQFQKLLYQKDGLEP